MPVNVGIVFIKLRVLIVARKDCPAKVFVNLARIIAYTQLSNAWGAEEIIFVEYRMQSVVGGLVIVPVIPIKSFYKRSLQKLTAFKIIFNVCVFGFIINYFAYPPEMLHLRSIFEGHSIGIFLL